jgi:hypothetical protein
MYIAKFIYVYIHSYIYHRFSGFEEYVLKHSRETSKQQPGQARFSTYEKDMTSALCNAQINLNAHHMPATHIETTWLVRISSKSSLQSQVAKLVFDTLKGDLHGEFQRRSQQSF